MTSPNLGTAHVDVKLDVSKIGPALRKAMSGVGKRELDAMENRFAKSGDRAGRKFGSEFSRSAKTHLGGLSKSAGATGNAAGTQYGIEFGKAAQKHLGGLSKSAGTSGDRAGKNFGAAFAKSAAPRMSAVQQITGKVAVGGGRGGGVSPGFSRGLARATVAATAFSIKAAPIAALIGGIAAASSLASGALLPLPAIAGAAGVGIGALVVGFQGMGDALKAGLSGDAEDLNKALKELTPNAQSTAVAFAKLKPQLTAIREATQDNLFAGMSGEIEKLGGSLLPTLERGLAKVATGINAQFKALFGGLGDAANVKDFDHIFDNMAKGAERFAPGVRALVDAFTGLAAVGSDFLPAMADHLTAGAEAFSNWVSEARESGKLHDIIRTTSDLLGQLGRAIGTAAQNLGPLFSSIASSVVPALSDALVGISEALGGMPDIGPLLGDLVRTFGDLLTAAMPLVEPLLKLANAALKPLVPVIEALVPGLSSLADGFTGLLNSLPPLGAAVGAAALAFLVLSRNARKASRAVSGGGLVGAMNGVGGASKKASKSLKGTESAMGRVAGGAGAMLGKLKGARGGLVGLAAAALLPEDFGANMIQVDGIQEKMKTEAPKIKRIMQSMFGDDNSMDLGELIGGSFDTGFTVFGDTVRGVTGALTGNEEAVKNLRREYGTLIEGTAMPSEEAMKLVRANQKIGESSEGFWKFGEAVNSIGLGVGDVMSSVGEGVASLGESAAALPVASQAVGGFWDALGGGAEQATGAVGSAALALTDTMPAAVGSVGSAVAETFAGMTAAASTWSWDITSIFGTGMATAQATVGAGLEGVGVAVATGSVAAAGRANEASPVFGWAAQGWMSMLSGQTAAGFGAVGSAVASGSVQAAQQTSAFQPVASGIFSAAFGHLTGVVGSGFAGLTGAVGSGVQQAAGAARPFGSLIKDAVGTVDLQPAGYAIGLRLAAGIRSSAGAVGSAMASVAAGIGSYLPMSPPKRGPLSGQGDPLRSGGRISTRLASGIQAGLGPVSRATSRVAGVARMPGGLGAVGGRPAGSAGSAPVSHSRTVHVQQHIHSMAQDPRAVAAAMAARFNSLAGAVA